MASDRVIAEHNQAKLSKLEARTANNVYTKALGGVTGMTQLKMQAKNPAASRLGDSGDKVLGTKYAYQAMLKQNSR